MKKTRKKEGSITVEAALVLPIFISFFMVFMYFFHILIIQEHLQDGITKAGLQIAKQAYVIQKISDRTEKKEEEILEKSEGEIRYGDILGALKDQAYLQYQVLNYVDLDYLNNSCIEGGYWGINFLSSSILDGDDYIDLSLKYKVKIPSPFFNLRSNVINQQVKLRAWTGMWVNKNNGVDEGTPDEDIVYITRTGSVYHTSPYCSHIKLSIQSVRGVPVNLRNENGGKYHPCEICEKTPGPSSGIYYIGKYGSRYHSNPSCSGIKRDVQEINIKDVGGRRICKRCGKEN